MMTIDDAVPTRRPRLHEVAKAQAPISRPMPHVISVTSGKGGVGKTNVTANLGWQLRQLRRRVLILDADLGLANIDVVLGLSPTWNMSHFISGEKTLEEILVKGPAGLRVLPAGSGVSDMTSLTDAQKLRLLEELDALAAEFDFLLIDSAAGISQNVIYFNLAAQTTIVIVTPEPTSLTDAYATIKVLSRQYRQDRFQILANEVKDGAEGMAVFGKLAKTTDRFLNVSLDYLGHVPHDSNVTQAVRLQKPFSEVFPEGPAAAAMRALARRVTALEHDPYESDLGLLWRNLLTPQGGSKASATA
jgi:flagellar biosynthesis protein FlhG